MTNRNEVAINVVANNREAVRVFQDTRKRVDELAGQVRKVGLAMTAAGGAVLGLGATTIQSALEQQRAFATLGVAVENAGASFEQLRPSIEAATAALQRKTNFGDEEQARVLARMIPIIGDVDAAMAALPAVLDAATVSGSDATTVATTLSRALAGQANTAESVGLTFDETAGFSERLALTLAAVGGAAEANADPFKQLSNDIGDLREAIGEALLPILVPLVKRIRDIVTTAIAWARANPQLIQTLAKVAAGVAAAGAALIALGTILPPIITAIGILISPIGLVIAALALLATAWVKNWGGMRDVVRTVGNFITDAIEFLVNNWIDNFNFLIRAVNKVIPIFNKLHGTSIPLIEEISFELTGMREAFNTGLDKVEDFADGILNLVSDFENLKVPVNDAAISVKNFGNEAVEDIGKVLDAFSTPTTQRLTLAFDPRTGNLRLFSADILLEQQRAAREAAEQLAKIAEEERIRQEKLASDIVDFNRMAVETMARDRIEQATRAEEEAQRLARETAQAGIEAERMRLEGIARLARFAEFGSDPNLVARTLPGGGAPDRRRRGDIRFISERDFEEARVITELRDRLSRGSLGPREADPSSNIFFRFSANGRDIAGVVDEDQGADVENQL